MRLISILFVVALAAAAFGFARGWFLVTPANPPDHAYLSLTSDNRTVARDDRAATVGVETATLADTAPTGNFTEGRIAALDAETHALTLQAGAQKQVHRLGRTVPISCSGVGLTLEDLRIDMHVRLSFDATNPTPILIGVAVLP
jgi:hypothetical protein